MSEEKKIEKTPSEIFKGLSVRAEYGEYRFQDGSKQTGDEERNEHIAELTDRIHELTRDDKHIAQGLYW